MMASSKARRWARGSLASNQSRGGARHHVRFNLLSALLVMSLPSRRRRLASSSRRSDKFRGSRGGAARMRVLCFEPRRRSTGTRATAPTRGDPDERETMTSGVRTPRLVNVTHSQLMSRPTDASRRSANGRTSQTRRANALKLSRQVQHEAQEHLGSPRAMASSRKRMAVSFGCRQHGQAPTRSAWLRIGFIVRIDLILWFRHAGRRLEQSAHSAVEILCLTRHAVHQYGETPH